LPLAQHSSSGCVQVSPMQQGTSSQLRPSTRQALQVPNVLQTSVASAQHSGPEPSPGQLLPLAQQDPSSVQIVPWAQHPTERPPPGRSRTQHVSVAVGQQKLPSQTIPLLQQVPS
jgi:hypothetical protein